jgi:hypothetical protein
MAVIIYIPTSSVQGFCFFISLPTLAITGCNNSHSNWGEVCLIVVLICIFLVTVMVSICLYTCWLFVCFLLRNVYSGTSLAFKLGFVFLLLSPPCLFLTSYMFLNTGFLQIYDLQMFSSIVRALYSLVFFTVQKLCCLM